MSTMGMNSCNEMCYVSEMSFVQCKYPVFRFHESVIRVLLQCSM
jgi:hypothetical protein